MARVTRIATIGPKPQPVDLDLDFSAIEARMIALWQSRFDKVLPDKPDLIVVPEACDRPGDFPRGRLHDYYRSRGTRVRDFFAGVARDNRCHIVYSASRELDDGSWRNSSVLIGPKGEVIGIYDKNHLVIEETTDLGVLCGDEAPVFACDFGRVACAICFDLNFDELRLAYADRHPELILFSSMYHGGMKQEQWAYSCRSYFVGAIAGPPSQIRNPFGEVVASTTNYTDYVVADVNLDYCLAHLDYNREKLVELKRSRGRQVEIYDPGLVGSVLISSNAPDIDAVSMAKEFDIELLDDYFARARAHRAAHTAQPSA